MKRRETARPASGMPEHLVTNPGLDQPISVWRGWWRARREWREAHPEAADGTGSWIGDVSLLFRLQHQRWAAEARARGEETNDER